MIKEGTIKERKGKERRETEGESKGKKGKGWNA